MGLIALFNLLACEVSAQTTELISSAPNGQQATTFISEAIVSKTGRYVLFLGEGDLLKSVGCPRWWLRDRETDTTELVSRSAAGQPVDCPSLSVFDTLSAEISADGRYVVYDYYTPTLDPAAVPVGRRVYLLDRTLNVVRLIGPPPAVAAVAPRMDDAGRRVLMGVATSPFRLQVYDLVTSEVIQVTNGETVNSLQMAISGDGRRVVYVGRAAGLPDDVPNQIYLFDLDSGSRELVSVGPNGEPANQLVQGPTINYDGSVVAFMSDATNLVDFQGSSILARYVEHDRTELVSFDSTGQPITGGGYLEWPSISDDGTRIAFRANGFNLPGRLDAIPNFPQAYVVDIPSRQVILVSRNDAGVGARYGASVSYCEEAGSIVLCSPKLNLSPNISGNGQVVGFHSFGTNLIPNDANGNAPDVYVRDLGPGGVGTPAPSPVPLSPAVPWVLGALFIALGRAVWRTA